MTCYSAHGICLSVCPSYTPEPSPRYTTPRINVRLSSSDIVPARSTTCSPLFSCCKGLHFCVGWCAQNIYWTSSPALQTPLGAPGFRQPPQASRPHQASPTAARHPDIRPCGASWTCSQKKSLSVQVTDGTLQMNYPTQAHTTRLARAALLRSQHQRPALARQVSARL
jgi:hypothetical protein